MRIRIVPIAVALAICTAVPAAPATTRGAADLNPVALGTGSTLWLEGTSSIHEYESRTSDLHLSMGHGPIPTDPAGFAALARGAGIGALELDVPIASMRSGKSGLDKNLQKALRAATYPTIHFKLDHYVVSPGSANRDTAEIEASGSLTVNGRERAETLGARLYRDAAGVWLTGAKPLLMSDFDVKPPTMMMGALKVHDPVTIHYRLLLATAGVASRVPSSHTP